MQRLTNALRFIDFSIRMALKYEALQKPWMVLSLSAGVLTALWLLPLGLLIRWLGSWPIVWVLVGVIILLYVGYLRILGEITALRTAQIFSGLINGGEGAAFDESPMAVFNTHGGDVLLYMLAAPGLNLLLAFQELFSKPSQTALTWKKAHPLIPPIIALEDLNLKGAIEAVKAIVTENLLRFQPGYLPVGGVARVVEWGLILIGFTIGGVLSAKIAEPLFAASWRSFFAVGTGLVAAGILSVAGIAFSSYSRSCYHTVLHTWACKVQAVQGTPGAAVAAPPEILSAAMTKNVKDGSRKGPEDGKEGSDATKT